MPHPVRDSDIRAAGFPVIGNEVFDGHFRTVFQPDGKIGKTAVQFFGLLRVQFAPFGGQPGSFPYRRFVARQCGKRRELCGPVAEEEVIKALNDVNGLWEFMFPGTKSELLRMVLGKILVFPEQISFALKVEGLKDLAEEMAMAGFFNMTHEENTEIFPEAEQEVLEDGSIKLTVNVDSKRIDGHRHLVILAPGAERLKQTSLLRAIQKSRQWTDMLINGEADNVTALAEKLGHKPSYVTRILSLNNLAPDIVESILAGTEPDGMSIAKLTAQPIPEDWNEQRRLYGFPVR